MLEAKLSFLFREWLADGVARFAYGIKQVASFSHVLLQIRPQVRHADTYPRGLRLGDGHWPAHRADLPRCGVHQPAVPLVFRWHLIRFYRWDDRNRISH